MYVCMYVGVLVVYLIYRVQMKRKDYSLGIPDTNFKGRSTRMALSVLRSTSGPKFGYSVTNLFADVKRSKRAFY